MGGDAYSLEGMLAELVDEIIPGQAPGSIVKTYLMEALAQSGGHALLGTFQGPRTGQTVGTALVGRGHGLCPTYMTGTVLESEPSLVWWLLERGVRLDVPDAKGNSALISGLTGPFGGKGVASCFRPNQLFSLHHLEQVFPSEPIQRPSWWAHSLLTLDPSGASIASVKFSPVVFAFASTRLMEALKDPDRTAQENVDWVSRALPASHGYFTPLLNRAAAHWQGLVLESGLPLACSSPHVRTPRF